MAQRSKPIRYRHKRKTTLSQKLKKLGRQLWKAFKKKFKKDPAKVSVIILGITAIFALMIMHSLNKVEPISQDGYVHAEKFNGYVVADGIDVSYAQGDVDFKSIKKSGIDFVFIRAGFRDTSEGNLHVDERFEENIKAARKAHLAVGLYYFSQATTSKEAKEEAEALLELAKPYEIDLPLVMDYEKHEGGRLSKIIAENNMKGEMLNKIALAFTNTVEKAGYESAVYANYDFLMHYLDGVALSKQTNIWTAQYNSFAQFPGDYLLWQCTDSLQLEGTESTYVDRDFLYLPTDGIWPSHSADSENRTSIGDCTIELKKHHFRYVGLNIEPKLKVHDGKIKLK
ncbi:MAG: hypothetical protein KBS68_06595, partial [Clostridiales bacterium]|nr:hypothetical protein [Candidatus Crickella merdequi]